jgi:hypothetical protein
MSRNTHHAKIARDLAQQSDLTYAQALSRVRSASGLLPTPLDADGRSRAVLLLLSNPQNKQYTESKGQAIADDALASMLRSAGVAFSEYCWKSQDHAGFLKRASLPQHPDHLENANGSFIRVIRLARTAFDELVEEQGHLPSGHEISTRVYSTMMALAQGRLSVKERAVPEETRSEIQYSALRRIGAVHGLKRFERMIGVRSRGPCPDCGNAAPTGPIDHYGQQWCPECRESLNDMVHKYAPDPAAALAELAREFAERAGTKK